MGADFASFLENVNIFSGKFGEFSSGFVLLESIRQMERARKPRRPRADDQNIRFEDFVFTAHGSILAEAQAADIRTASKVL